MEDKYSKYINLSLKLFLTFFVFVVSLLLLLFGLKLIFGLLDSIPWFVVLYLFIIIIVPAALFISIFLIYFRRTRSHPSLAVRWISYIVFSIALCGWGVSLVLDMIHFVSKQSREIGGYYGYNIFLLAGSVALIFLVGVMQALAGEKEKDWMERRRGEG